MYKPYSWEFMKIRQLQLFVIAIGCSLIAGWYWSLWQSLINAAGGSCTLLQNNEYVVCALKHSIYGSFGSAFTLLAIIFWICGILEYFKSEK